jgi:hypothetical protein
LFLFLFISLCVSKKYLTQMNCNVFNQFFYLSYMYSQVYSHSDKSFFFLFINFSVDYVID